MFSVGKYNGMFNESERAGKVLNRFNEKSQTNQDYFYECLCQFTCRGRGCLPEYIHAGAYGRANPYMVHCVFASLECVRNRPCRKIRPPVFPDAKGCVTGCPCGAMRWNIAERFTFIVERLNFRQNNAKMHAMQPPSHTRSRTYARESKKHSQPLLPSRPCPLSVETSHRGVSGCISNYTPC